jgi:PHP family Zn ribbon phosphoesterase
MVEADRSEIAKLITEWIVHPPVDKQERDTRHEEIHNAAMKIMADSGLVPETMKYVARMCYQMEDQTKKGAAFAYGCHSCGDTIMKAAEALEAYLVVFGRN